MTKDEAQAFKARYELANALEVEELRSTSIELKLRQTDALMASAKQMGWDEQLQKEEAEVRELWLRLKRAYLNPARDSD
ncbi:MAG TPA: hypothetical protein VNN73_07595 [Blastocatellia bacterium]|nr:hypothetical protein [Blastocatellia bacterium]